MRRGVCRRRELHKVHTTQKAVVTWEIFKNVSYVPPFSVFDARQGYWQKRKKEWREAGLKSDDGRDDALIGKGLKKLADVRGMSLTGTSVFDPMLCEVLYNWYSPPGGIVFDPFAGGSVRGVVAELLGRHYIGIDLSERQVDANRRNGDAFGVCPAWHVGDSRDADNFIPDGSADFVFSCPPYHDLEQYSDHPLDLSNMTYPDFCEAYGDIIGKSCRKLKDDRFAVFVVGEIRDKRGAYRDFVGLTKRLFMADGLHLYNDGVLLETYGTAPMRAGKQFSAGRKTVKVHQNVLVFYKGDMRKIRDNFGTDFHFVDLSRFSKE